jgi:hypothetical protein
VIKIITSSCFAALVLAAQGGESAAMKPAPKSVAGASAGDFFLGANVREDAWYSYVGADYALNGDKETSGFITQAFVGYGEYSYDTLLGGVDGEVSEVDLGVGYQWVLPSYRVSLLAAVNFVDHDLTGNPIDLANNSVNGDEVGFKPKLDIWNRDTSSFIYGGTFTYSTAYDTYWNRAMFATRVGSVYLGPEVIVQGNEEYEEVRAGLALTGLQLGIVNLGGSVGYSWADPDQGSSDQEGIYSSIHMSINF